MASPCLAGFTGFSVEYRGNIDNRNVFQVFANFDASTDILLSVLKHNVTSGSMSGVLHNDAITVNGGAGSWNPAFTLNAQQRANDSFVTISGLTGANAQTSFDPGFGDGFGPVIPNGYPDGAGWYNSSPFTNPIVIGTSLRIMIMQVALAIGDPGYTASLEVAYKANASDTTALFGAGIYTIVPTPATLLARSSQRQ
jgi:hypothetical protein